MLAIHVISRNCPSASSPSTKCPVALYSTITEGVGTIKTINKFSTVYKYFDIHVSITWVDSIPLNS